MPTPTGISRPFCVGSGLDPPYKDTPGAPNSSHPMVAVWAMVSVSRPFRTWANRSCFEAPGGASYPPQSAGFLNFSGRVEAVHTPRNLPAGLDFGRSHHPRGRFPSLPAMHRAWA